MESTDKRVKAGANGEDKKGLTKCEWCGVAVGCEQTFEVEGRVLCAGCVETETDVCEYCENRVLQENIFSDEYIRLCRLCYQDCSVTCYDCGRIVLEDYWHYIESSDHYVCDDCYRENEEIHNCDYKPEAVFYGGGGRYFGVELEIDGGGEDDGNAREFLSIANPERERLYCKRDGSLKDGIELVTHPMTLRYHREEMAWRELLEKAVELGYTSHNAGTCGLHIHVNRDSLGSNLNEQEEAIARVLYFVETHWVEMLRLSRRKQKELAMWASRYGRKDSPKDVYDNAKQSYARYRSVNVCPSNTIEFRLFRGTLKLSTLIASLQLVNEICNLAVEFTDVKMDNYSWSDFVAGINTEDAPELVNYLRERRLYVNEPVAAEREI